MQFLFDRIDEEASRRPEIIVMRDDAKSLTWVQLRNAVAHHGLVQQSLGRRIGLLSSNSCEYVVAQLAAAFSGLTLVPLPAFFSNQQLTAIAENAGLDAILVDAAMEPRAATLKLPSARIALNEEAAHRSRYQPGFEIVTYTSGSSGTPKGVCLGETQIEAAVRGLASASGGSAEDRYLSVLPLPMLLETICAIFVPLFCGATVRLATAVAEEVSRGNPQGILGVLVKEQPTATVLVPQLLKALLFQMKAMNVATPQSLRFVAVGGASVPPAVLDLAEHMGMPVYEGYGLSECASVVTLNRPGNNRHGTAGTPIGDVQVLIEDGEIIVASPTVMNHYLGGPPVAGRWRTGDLGSLDEGGFLTIHGRKDNLIVTAFGRNVSPEWVETALTADPRIAVAVVSGSGRPALHALIIPSAYGEQWFAAAGAAEIRALVASLCTSLPDYAVPAEIQVLDMRRAAEALLITANGRPIRCRVHDFVETPRAVTTP